jgi:uncharacterized membrane protein
VRVSDIVLLGLLVGLFVVSHELLSHPLRAPLVARLGEKGFALVYSLVALGSFGTAVQLWGQIPKARLWDTPAAAYGPALALMLLAFILFVGSVSSPNPAMMPGVKGEPKGMQRITRHPMMWSFVIWAGVHIVMTADPRTIVLGSGVAALALIGTFMQDIKKKAQNASYGAHMARTSHVPFAAILGGRQPLSALWPGLVPVVLGTVLWFLFLGWGHTYLIGVRAAGWSYMQ